MVGAAAEAEKISGGAAAPFLCGFFCKYSKNKRKES